MAASGEVQLNGGAANLVYSGGAEEVPAGSGWIPEPARVFVRGRVEEEEELVLLL